MSFINSLADVCSVARVRVVGSEKLIPRGINGIMLMPGGKPIPQSRQHNCSTELRLAEKPLPDQCFSLSAMYICCTDCVGFAGGEF